MEKSVRQQFLDRYDDLADAIFRHCYFRVSDREVALDLMQETFLKTWKYLDAGNDINDVKAFLYKVANNMVIDYYRKKKTISLESITENEESNFEPSDDSHTKIVSDSEFNLVMQMVEELDGPHKEVLIMRYIDGLSPKDIAEITGDSANSISVRIVRAMEKLKDKMK